MEKHFVGDSFFCKFAHRIVGFIGKMNVTMIQTNK